MGDRGLGLWIGFVVVVVFGERVGGEEGQGSGSGR